MGFALADELAAQGANVTLVAGPVSLKCTHPAIHRVDVTSAEEMKAACLEVFAKTDGAIMCAAVADYRPKYPAEQKIKRTADNMTIELEPNDDIAACLGKLKSDRQVLVGFALETHDEASNAVQKMVRKNLDFIVLNSLQDKGAGFGVDTNKISILTKDNKVVDFQLKMKMEVARDIVNHLVTALEKR